MLFNCVPDKQYPREMEANFTLACNLVYVSGRNVLVMKGTLLEKKGKMILNLPKRASSTRLVLYAIFD